MVSSPHGEQARHATRPAKKLAEASNARSLDIGHTKPLNAQITSELADLKRAMELNPRESPIAWFKKRASSDELSPLAAQWLFLRRMQQRPEISWLFPCVRSPLTLPHDAPLLEYIMPKYEADSLRRVLLHPHTDPVRVYELGRTAIKAAVWALKHQLFDPSSSNHWSESQADYYKVFYDGKLVGRLTKVRQMIASSCAFSQRTYLGRATKDLLDARYIQLNGRVLSSPTCILQRALSDPAISALLLPPAMGEIAGDLHLDNILVHFDETYKLDFLKVVDPRGFSRPVDLAYDIGKILHSLHGKYDFIQEGLMSLCLKNAALHGDVFSVSGGWTASESAAAHIRGGSLDRSISFCASQTDSRILAFGAIERWLVDDFLPQVMPNDRSWRVRAYLNEALHFLTMLPFHVAEQPDIVWLFYLRGVELINDWWEDVTSMDI